MFIRPLSQRPTEAGDVASEIIFFHCRVGPNESHQLVLLYDSVPVLNQD
jgi:hypothetical protein